MGCASGADEDGSGDIDDDEMSDDDDDNEDELVLVAAASESALRGTAAEISELDNRMVATDGLDGNLLASPPRPEAAATSVIERYQVRTDGAHPPEKWRSMASRSASRSPPKFVAHSDAENDDDGAGVRSRTAVSRDHPTVDSANSRNRRARKNSRGRIASRPRAAWRSRRSSSAMPR